MVTSAGEGLEMHVAKRLVGVRARPLVHATESPLDWQPCHPERSRNAEWTAQHCRLSCGACLRVSKERGAAERRRRSAVGDLQRTRAVHGTASCALQGGRLLPPLK